MIPQSCGAAIINAEGECVMNEKTPGELAFEEYLNGERIPFDREPPLSFTTKLIDYVIDHPANGKIYFEVKDIRNSPFEGMGSFGQFDPYEPIRSHIVAGMRKFSGDFSNQLCAIVLFSETVNLMEPHVMLGSMYGNLGFTMPVNTETGIADVSKIESEFFVGEGMMVRSSEYRNTRLAALISLARYHTFTKEAMLYACTEDGRSEGERWEDALSGRAGIKQEPTLCVTVWENGTAKRKMPQDLFRGPMDAWWTCGEDGQGPSFIGERRRALGIDKCSR
jgi:hypothetical protein